MHLIALTKTQGNIAQVNVNQKYTRFNQKCTHFKLIIPMYAREVKHTLSQSVQYITIPSSSPCFEWITIE